jgi:8-oxo-dGTP pyrophosphatase MutT (NUDIX family)
MVTENLTERFVNTKLSVAVVAYCGNLADFVDTRVLMVKNREGLVGPVAGNIEKAEHPLAALEREWYEETGGEPFTFQNGSLRFKDVLFSQGNGYIDLGFVYHARLTESQIRLFDEGKFVTNDEDIVEAKLFDMDELLVVLRDWRNKLTHPQINAQTLINIVNNVMVNHDDYIASPVSSDDLFTLEYFGMDFTTTSLSFGIDK